MSTFFVWPNGTTIKVRSSVLPRKLLRARGFSLFEVLVAIIVAGLFFLVVIQSSTLSSYNRAQALESSEVLAWVQKDMESIRFEASRYLMTRLSRSAQPNDSYISVDSTDNFDDAASFQLIEVQNQGAQTFTTQDTNSPTFSVPNPTLGALQTPGLDKAVSQNQDSRVYKMSRAIGDRIDLQAPDKIAEPHPVGTSVVGIFKNCQARSSPDGLANSLRTQLTGQLNINDVVSGILPLEQTRTSTNKQFTVRRDLNLIQNPPYHRLQVRYTVFPPEETSPPAQDTGNLRAFVMEVIPDAAFYCP